MANPFRTQSKFQLTAARRRLVLLIVVIATLKAFQLTAARRRLARRLIAYPHGWCFNSQPPEGGWPCGITSRSGAACFNSQPPEGGWQIHQSPHDARWRFNSQPPEGGWAKGETALFGEQMFQLTAARRRLDANLSVEVVTNGVSTHSRPKAAGKLSSHSGQYSIGFNSQPPEGGWTPTDAMPDR